MVSAWEQNGAAGCGSTADKGSCPCFLLAVTGQKVFGLIARGQTVLAIGAYLQYYTSKMMWAVAETKSSGNATSESPALAAQVDNTSGREVLKSPA